MIGLHLLVVCAVGLAAVWTVYGQGEDEEYIMTFEEVTTVEEVNTCIQTLENEYGIDVKNVYHFDKFSVLHVSGTVEDITRAEELPKIEFIEQNADADANQDGDSCAEIPSPGTWGLDRIDQIEPLICRSELSDMAVYTIGPYTGAGVTAYIVDTGIDVSHPEFDGRASWGYTAVGIAGNTDDNGHGTHVAGTVGAISYGVAKDVTLVAVKVLKSDGQGTYASILDGLSWVYNDLVTRDTGGVVTLSWSGPKHSGINRVILSLVRKKGVIVAAAGNNNQDARLKTPASAPATTTVAAMNIGDKASVFSNWGSGVTLYAPGQSILSTWPGNSTQVLSGTSFAAAHVAGVAALKLSKEERTSGQIRAWLVRRSWKNILTMPDANHAKSPNRLLRLDCMLLNN